MRRAILPAGAAFFLMVAVAAACRYTVRDIGFVDLRGAEYVLRLRGPVFSEHVGPIRDRLQEANVQLSFDAAPPDDAPWSIELIDADGRHLTLSEAGAPPNPIELIDTMLFSAATDRLTRSAGNSFAQLVLIEGSNTRLNEHARVVMRDAEAALRRIEPLLPRPLQHPARTWTIPFADRSSERVLLWSFGLDPPAPQDAPVLAVVYGRGRLAGRPQVGERIMLRETLAQLALVGESCECETDREWLQERMIVMEWDAASRRSAAESLGFDPENPLVQAEIVRIVAHNAEGRSAGNGGGSDAIERILLGYEETRLQPVGGEAVASENRESLSPGSGVTANIQTGDGWDFDEPTPRTSPGDATASNERGPLADPDPPPSTVAASAPAAGERSTAIMSGMVIAMVATLAGLAIVAVVVVATIRGGRDR